MFSTPQKLEAHLNQCEFLLLQKLSSVAQKPLAKNLAILAFLAPLVFLLNFEFLVPPKISRFDVAYFGRVAFFYVCLGAILVPWISMSLRPAWLFLTCALAWTRQVTDKAEQVNTLELLRAALPIPSLLLAMFLLHKAPILSWKIKSGALLLVFCVLALTVAPNSNGSMPYYVFWSIQPEFFLFLFPFLLKESTPQKAEIWLNPANTLAGTLWPSSRIISEKNNAEFTKNWAQGFLDLIRSQIFLFFSFLLPIDNGFIFEYLFRLFVMIGVANAISGVARIYGFEVPNATNHLFFMRTPTDYWRRGASYIYEFLFKNIYFPVARKTKSVFLAILLCMLAMLFHSTIFHGFFLPTIHSLPINKHPLFYGISITIFWLPLFYLGGDRWNSLFIFFPNKCRRWLEIIATHILVMCLYFVAKNIATTLLNYS
jgi:hypothetical protein